MMEVIIRVCPVLLLAISVQSNVPEVTIEQGILRGQYLETFKGYSFSSFTAIPYAEPPIGALRFRKPKPAGRWRGIRNATISHPACPQRNVFAASSGVMGDEDCLYLNVYTPQIIYPSEQQLSPVMIFFHGGGFVAGDGSREAYDPSKLLDQDIVLVIPNYRLSALGFLSTGDEEVPGNNGLKDQNLVIKWVKKNIIHFGGDPNRITLFGQSAGGSSAHFHMLSPLSRDLISGVISESGTALSLWALAPYDQGPRNSRKLAQYFNCTTQTTREMVECLRRVNAYELIRQEEMFYEWHWHPLIPFKPVVEPNLEGAFLPEHPRDLIKSGKAAKIPFVTGITTEDGTFLSASIFGQPSLLEELNENFDTYAPVSLLYSEAAADKEYFTKTIKKFYFNDEGINNSSRSAVTDMYTDALFLLGAHEAVQLHLKYTKQPVYYYAFGYRGTVSFSSIFGDPVNDYGVCHADELLYLFTETRNFPDYVPSAADKNVSDILTTLWANFATEGNPTPSSSPLLLKKWRAVISEKLEYYSIKSDTDIKMSKRLYWRRAEFWKNLWTNSKNDSISESIAKYPVVIKRRQEITWNDYWFVDPTTLNVLPYNLSILNKF